MVWFPVEMSALVATAYGGGEAERVRWSLAVIVCKER